MARTFFCIICGEQCLPEYNDLHNMYEVNCHCLASYKIHFTIDPENDDKPPEDQPPPDHDQGIIDILDPNCTFFPT